MEGTASMEKTRMNSVTALACSLQPLTVFSKMETAVVGKNEIKHRNNEEGIAVVRDNKHTIQHSDQLTTQNIFILARH